MLNIKNLSKSFNGLRVLADLSLTLPAEGFYLLYGSNGSGKSTLFKILMGLLKTNEGKIEMDDEDLTSLAVYKRALKGLQYLPQDSALLIDKTVLQNLDLARQSLAKNQMLAENREIYNLLNINILESKQVSSLSRGELRRFEFYLTVSAKGKIFMFDEPFAGWDKTYRAVALKILLDLAKQNLILFCEHDTSDVLIDSCHGFLYLKEGRIDFFQNKIEFLSKLRE